MTKIVQSKSCFVSMWITLDGALLSEITGLIKRFSKKYKVYANLQEWRRPHITLLTLRFDGGDGKEFLQVVNVLESMATNLLPFKIDINGIGHVRRRKGCEIDYVIFLKVKETALLRQLRSTINFNLHIFKAHKLKEFPPHITIAYKDLTKKKFCDALNEYGNLKFSRSFVAKKIEVNAFFEDTRKRRKVKTIKLGSNLSLSIRERL